MITSITPKAQSALKSNIGQYHVIKKELELWINSGSLIFGEEYITIPDFNFPNDTEKLYIIDTNIPDGKFKVPVEDFKKFYIKDLGYKFKYSDFSSKYKRAGIPNQVL